MVRAQYICPAPSIEEARIYARRISALGRWLELLGPLTDWTQQSHDKAVELHKEATALHIDCMKLISRTSVFCEFGHGEGSPSKGAGKCKSAMTLAIGRLPPKVSSVKSKAAKVSHTGFCEQAKARLHQLLPDSPKAAAFAKPAATGKPFVHVVRGDAKSTGDRARAPSPRMGVWRDSSNDERRVHILSTDL